MAGVVVEVEVVVGRSACRRFQAERCQRRLVLAVRPVGRAVLVLVVVGVGCVLPVPLEPAPLPLAPGSRQSVNGDGLLLLVQCRSRWSRCLRRRLLDQWPAV